jgi:hypothetical protein
MQFCLRLLDLPSVRYESKNILWMTELPQRSNATPIIVQDRIFVMAEPDELLCLDKNTGRILWSAAINYYEALSSAERWAKPAYRKRVDPLVAQLQKEKDRIRRVKLRARIQEALLAIDAGRYALKLDGHYGDHFGIVGFTTPTPVSDGKRVYAWCGNGVAACYDLEGKRQWITRIKAEALSYSSSPALVDGVLAVFQNQVTGLDARTGKVRWQQRRIGANSGALIPARIAGTPVIVSQRGSVVRATDGKLLFRPRGPNSGETSWAPPVVLGEVMYLPNYGVNRLNVIDFTGVRGDDWRPKTTAISLPEGMNRKPDGGWIDRMTAGSPLVFSGLAYNTDIYGLFCVIDLKAQRMSYRRQTELHGLFHYNALPVAASPALVGKHIVVQDNQGTALVLESGRKYRVRSKNRIATEIDRWWPIPGQETVAYTPPVADGKRLYLRGERYLYCIGVK